MLAGSAVVIWNVIRVAMRDSTRLFVLPVALFLVAAPATLFRIRPRLTFWFPNADALLLKNVETLGATGRRCSGRAPMFAFGTYSSLRGVPRRDGKARRSP